MTKNEKLEKIETGWQYTIYDIGGGRVLKKRYSRIKQYFFIRSREKEKGRPHSFFKTIIDMYRVNRAVRKASKYIKNVLPIMNSQILGNPVFINQIDYEQDKVSILRDILYSCSIEQGKGILSQYADLIHTTWQYGFSDMMYNFLGNNGLDENGNVIQVDFGELIFDKSRVAQRIKNKRWLKTTSFVNFPEGELKDYYRTIMNEKVTLSNLEKFWGLRFHKIGGR